jgi:hypothetical protein
VAAVDTEAAVASAAATWAASAEVASAEVTWAASAEVTWRAMVEVTTAMAMEEVAMALEDAGGTTMAMLARTTAHTIGHTAAPTE